ncbi:GxxExxY protein [Pelomonas sp. P7]|uniref:GxxExxY protein n=1 Tax=Pelomonas caseinilytica TaxID=2906763 RepID=A0ABS8X929_9BURK|nr:GxxExxY protein [Pelomonas sp. P7]MCE4537304.1 GxxExxY protein [Pelomonas sp. P7]
MASAEHSHRGTEAQRYRVSDAVIAAAIEVHKELGPGLFESAYEAAMDIELKSRGLAVERQLEVPMTYKGQPLGSSYRVDLVVDRELVVELKAVECLAPVHTAQVLTYLRLLKLRSGLLINFNHAQLRHGVKRIAL